MTLIADIFITTKGRPELFHRSISSLLENTPREQFRLTLIDDTGPDKVSWSVPRTGSFLPSSFDHIITHNENMGLGPSINQALAHIDALKKWDGQKAPPLTVYTQDDVIYEKDWLMKLAGRYLQLRDPLKLGFASGAECPEHPTRQVLGNGMILKDWVRATNLMATHEYWMSMWPISRIDPETGRERGRPHDGLGSSVDWWFIRNHENSVCRTGRTNLVIPGLVKHIGFDKSTWLDRELPESESDRKGISEHLQGKKELEE